MKDKFYPDGDVRQARSENEGRRQVGFIAQEVRAVNEKFAVENNIVSVDEDGFHGMDYPKLIVPVVRATQELNDDLKSRDRMIADLQTELAAQKTQINALLEGLTALKQQIAKP